MKTIFSNSARILTDNFKIKKKNFDLKKKKKECGAPTFTRTKTLNKVNVDDRKKTIFPTQPEF